MYMYILLRSVSSHEIDHQNNYCFQQCVEFVCSSLAKHLFINPQINFYSKHNTMVHNSNSQFDPCSIRSLGFTSWLWWFNSTQFIFSGCSKETWFLIPNYVCSEVNDSSYGKLERIQLDLIRSWDWMQNAANVHPFAHLPHLLPAYLANQLQSSQLLLFDVARFKELYWFSLRWIKINHSPVSLSSLYHWGDNLKGYLYQVNSDPNLVIF